MDSPLRPAQRVTPHPASRRNARQPHHTATEDAKLRELYPDAPKGRLLSALSGRSWLSLATRARRLGLTRHVGTDRTRWQPEALAAVREHYAARGPQWLAAQLSRPVAVITKAARRLGLPRYCPPPAPARAPAPPKARLPRPKAAKPARPAREPRPIKAKVVPAPPGLGRAANVLARPVAGRHPHLPSPKTPNANAAKAARLAKEKQAAAKPAGYVSAEQLRALPAGHPARVAYTNNAYKGMAAAQEAFHHAMQLAA